MLAPFLDHANLLYVLLASLALGAFVYAWLTNRPRIAVYGLAAVGLMLLLWSLGQLVVTDRQQILLNLDAMRDATVEGKPDVLFQHLAADFHFGKLDRDELYRRVSKAIGSHKTRVHLSNQQADVHGNVGEATFNFRADGADGSILFAASAKGTFVRDAGQWKLRSLEIHRLGTTERQPIPGID